MVRWIGVFLALLSVVESAQSDQGLYLHRIEVVGGEAETVSGNPLVIDLVAQDIERLTEALGNTTAMIQASDGAEIRVTLNGDDHLKGKPDARLRISSWVIDFDRPSVQSLLRTLRETFAPGEEIRPSDVSRFTHERISDKHYRTGFDIASQVAKSLEGDCTEHAVLNAALMRASGYSARVVLGVVIILGEREAMAAGHAWNEIYHGHDWHIHDATLPIEDSGEQRVFYLPLKALSDESPGYAKELLEFTVMRPNKIHVVE